mgnify:CR=1 FL=1|jgi:hypothetical protein
MMIKHLIFIILILSSSINIVEASVDCSTATGTKGSHFGGPNRNHPYSEKLDGGRCAINNAWEAASRQIPGGLPAGSSNIFFHCLNDENLTHWNTNAVPNKLLGVQMGEEVFDIYAACLAKSVRRLNSDYHACIYRSAFSCVELAHLKNARAMVELQFSDGDGKHEGTHVAEVESATIDMNGECHLIIKEQNTDEKITWPMQTNEEGTNSSYMGDGISVRIVEAFIVKVQRLECSDVY